ncbi:MULTISPECIES: hypothetical protein [Pontibacillus]|uniref:Uncharacterized protein n=1 Tax=Pontibacillus chungwhensis TaxID=265426 RepID=A0ABY8UV11_9BACI|nr:MULTISPECIES: hypothetical protein [Pontibacillus]MCD5322935.1 hypothetical protein [Pontibacillus sp. HN14]WIF96329.1 hypothetical protein QNI29_11240 [Pontibacillus chungwhensis]
MIYSILMVGILAKLRDEKALYLVDLIKGKHTLRSAEAKQRKYEDILSAR